MTYSFSFRASFSGFLLRGVLKLALLLFFFSGLLSGQGVTEISTKDWPLIRSGSEIDYPPFCLVDTAGKADGFSVELMRAALRAMNHRVSFRVGSWPEVRGWLERGEIAALPLVGRTPEREGLFDFTFPYMVLHGVIVVRSDNTEIANFADLRGKNVSVMAGDNAEEFLLRGDRGITVSRTDSFEESLRDLSQGRHDAVFMQRLVALRLISEAGLKNLRVIDAPVKDFSQEFCFAVKKGDGETLALLNEGLSIVMADGTFRRLHSKWFAALELPIDRKIIIGGDHNYPPFEFLDKNGLPAGCNVDITRAIADEIGVEMEIRLGSWVDMRRALEDGRIDALQGVLYSDERHEIFDFSPAHNFIDCVSVVRRGEMRPPTSVEELAGLRILLERGDIMEEFVTEHGLLSQCRLVNNQERALKELASGEADCALVSRVAALHLIEQNGLKNLDVGTKALHRGEYCYAVTKGNKALLALLGEGLKSVEKSGEYRRIYDKWMKVYEPPGVDILTILRYVLSVAIPLLLIILMFFIWTRTLRREVARRTSELEESQRRYREIFNGSRDGFVMVDADGRFIDANPAYCEMLGYSLAELRGMKDFYEVTPESWREWELEEIWDKQLLKHGYSGVYEKEYIHKDGTVFPVEMRSYAVFTDSGLEYLWGIARDISEQRRKEVEHRKLESQLQQMQKLESVGQLAGGVAHDFNNMLSVIIGYTEMAIAKSGIDESVSRDLEEVLKAAQRSAQLTRQLLAFARKQVIQPEKLDLNHTIESMLKMLERLIGEEVKLELIVGEKLWSVMMDPGQVDQIIANLCINAKNAISGGGTITIETANISLDNEYCENNPEAIPGDFVRLEISDDGCGMDAETLGKIFEPFFTTKLDSGGSGLGLATVYGIVKQNNGFVNVYSELGKGSAFRIYLPRVKGAAESGEPAVVGDLPHGQGELILLLEDETAIRKMTAEMLRGFEYDVLEAANPEEAISVAERYGEKIKLLITDIVMPGMNGRELAEKLQKTLPELKVLYMSGYTANVIVHRGVLCDDVNYLQKPFSSQVLAKSVKAAL